MACLFATPVSAQPKSPFDFDPNNPFDNPRPGPFDRPAPSTSPAAPPRGGPPVVGVMPPTAADVSPVGNWIAEYVDYPDVGRVLRVAMVVAPRTRWQCVAAEGGGCHLGRVAEVGSPLRVYHGPQYGSALYREMPAQRQGGMWTVKDLLLPSATVQVRLAAVTRDEMRGDWGKQGGSQAERRPVRWRRQLPRITRVKFVSEIESETTPGGAPARVRLTYQKVDWEIRMLGNAPRFFVEVYGDNLWGHHDVHLAGAVDMMTDATEMIRRGDGSSPPVADPSNRCSLDCSNTVGVRIPVLIFGLRPGRPHEIPRATPGRKMLVIGDVRIPFDLEIPGFPGPATSPTANVVMLRYVVLGPDGRYVPIQGEVKHGAVFCIEATFDRRPEQREYTVTLDWGGGRGAQVTVGPTDQPNVYRSEALRLQAPAAGP